MKVVVRIRSMVERDCEEVAEIARRAIRGVWQNFRSEEAIRAASARFNQDYLRQKLKTIEHWVAEYEPNQGLVGVVGLEGNRLRNFFVLPEYMNQGIGKALMEKVESLARARGEKKLEVISSDAAELVYEKLGFRKIKVIPERVAGNIFKEIYMIKLL